MKLGFDYKWVTWVIMCVTTVNYSVLMNGEATGTISPMRRFKQGDPLSPYLFIICTEGLSSLSKHAESRGDIHGVCICIGAPTVSHLLFTNDCFHFFRAYGWNVTI